jgi:beta-galactosidase
LLVTNRRSFTDLSDLRARWELLVDGVPTRRDTLRAGRIEPGLSVWVPMPVAVPASADVRLTIRWETKRETWFAPAGHLVAWDQVVVRESTAPAVLRGGDRADADLVDGPALCIFRAPTDNDGFKLMPELSRRIGVGGQALRRWQDAGVDVRPADELVGHTVGVDEGADGTRYAHVVDVPETLADLARVGVVFRLPVRFDRVRWFGRGPHENYPDRNRSAMLAVWESTIDELPYLVPQEFGLRTECRWLELIDTSSGERVRFDGFAAPLHCSVTRYEDEELYRAETAIDAVPADHVVVHLDVAHRGLGTASCGPDVLPPYRLGPGRYDLAYRVSRA